jgi:hypothetical protein
VRLPIEEIARSHLTLGPIVDRCFDRLDQHQASGLTSVGKNVFGSIALKPRFSQRRQERRRRGLLR